MAGIKLKADVSDMKKLKAKMSVISPRTEHVLATQIAKDTEPFVPMLTGSLKNRTRVVKGEIIYPGPYAHYLYVGKLMVDPQTGSPWASYGTTKVYTERPLVMNRKSHPDATDHWFEASKSINLEKWIRVAKKAVRSGY